MCPRQRGHVRDRRTLRSLHRCHAPHGRASAHVLHAVERAAHVRLAAVAHHSPQRALEDGEQVVILPEAHEQLHGKLEDLGRRHGPHGGAHGHDVVVDERAAISAAAGQWILLFTASSAEAEMRSCAAGAYPLRSR